MFALLSFGHFFQNSKKKNEFQNIVCFQGQLYTNKTILISEWK